MRQRIWENGFFTLVLGLFFTALLLPPVWATEDDAAQGKAKYEQAGCDGCHGKSGRGDGPAAMALNPKPSDFCTSKKHPTDADKMKMILGGGAQMGHSSLMPSYQGSLNQEDARNLVAYIKSLCEKR